MQNSTDQQKKHSWIRAVTIGRNPKFTFIRVIVLVVACLVIFNFVLLPIRVDGPSMSPTYKQNSVNFINRLSYLRKEPRRGDVVAIRYTGRSMMLMKRIVALPGETVEFVSGRIVINGRFLDEPYLKGECDWNFVPDHNRMSDDEYYVVGDNRAMPFENHYQGAAKRGRILGKAML